MNRRERIAETNRQIAAHPERFDYGDIPAPDRNSAEYERAMDELQAQWVKDLKAKRRA